MGEASRVLGFPPPAFDLMGRIRQRVHEVVEAAVEEELGSALGAAKNGRTEGRRGYRNGHVRRELLTEEGPCELGLPRGRLLAEDGRTSEWRSRIAARYARRTKRIDETILGC